MNYSYPSSIKRPIKLLFLALMGLIIMNFSCAQATEEETVIASFAAGRVDPDDFDIKGTIENINSLPDEDSADKQSEVEQYSILLNGEEYLFAPGAGIFNADAVAIDVNDIVVGAEVCFYLDPSNMIVELCLLQNNPEIDDYDNAQAEEEKGHSNQPNGSGDLRLENGVWVN